MINFSDVIDKHLSWWNSKIWGEVLFIFLWIIMLIFIDYWSHFGYFFEALSTGIVKTLFITSRIKWWLLNKYIIVWNIDKIKYLEIRLSFFVNDPMMFWISWQQIYRLRRWLRDLVEQMNVFSLRSSWLKMAIGCHSA